MNLQEMSKQLLTAVNAFCRTLDDGFRNHLGASEIGNPCERALWYGFRWVQKPRFEHTVDRKTGKVIELNEDKEARMRRLFARGHAEEDRLITILRGAGAQVEEFADPVEQTQHRIVGVGGHFGGSLDGFIQFANWPRAILEMKTHSAKSYEKLTKDGLEKSKARHVAQMNVYGYKTGTDLAIYVPIEKDSDSLDQIQVRKVDHEAGAALEAKAAKVIRSPLPLAKLHPSVAYFDCQYCDHKLICHDGAPVTEINCRSCRHSEPEPGPSWRCNAVGQTIPAEVIPKGCRGWQSVDT